MLGPRGKLHFPFQEHILGRVELVTLTALFVSCSAATLSGIAGFSPAYGAFLAGLYIGKTRLRTEAINAMEPIQGVLMVLFFVAIGLLLDGQFIMQNLGLVTAFVVGVLVVKSLANIVILRLVGLSWTDAYQAGLIIGQIGEFSFVLAAAGLANQVLDPVGYKLAISVIVLSLLISPLWMSAVRRVHDEAKSGVESLRVALVHAYSGEVGELTRAQAALARGFRVTKHLVGHPSQLQAFAMRAVEARRAHAAPKRAVAEKPADAVAPVKAAVAPQHQMLDPLDERRAREQQQRQQG